MTVFDFINQMSREELTHFISIIITGCLCCKDCPLKEFGSFTGNYDCVYSDKLSKWLDSECSESQIEDFRRKLK